ncbi:hypothetical protein FMEAI12_2440008 [Parafrankia sp. Ea1.12]|nr:hypothetical protein FMEAI12_2440008 [Parafrankia sp. Ea1.12]
MTTGTIHGVRHANGPDRPAHADGLHATDGIFPDPQDSTPLRADTPRDRIITLRRDQPTAAKVFTRTQHEYTRRPRPGGDYVPRRPDAAPARAGPGTHPDPHSTPGGPQTLAGRPTYISSVAGHDGRVGAAVTLFYPRSAVV